MASLLERLKADAAKLKATTQSESSSPTSCNEVQDTAELRRVAALPRRDWEMTARSVLNSEDTGLRQLQAIALDEIEQHGGAIVPAGVGAGKTLITFLAAWSLILGRHIEDGDNVLLLVPAKLREKTRRDFKKLESIETRWGRYTQLTVLSYAQISSAKGEARLKALAPAAIIADECHKLKNPDAAVTRKVGRYLAENECRFIGLSGTITKKSIHDYAHLLCWALKEPPIPTNTWERNMWADALDVELRGANKQGVFESNTRTAPGSLVLLDPVTRTLVTTKRTLSLAQAREVYQQRLRETPGVIATTDASVDCEIDFDFIEPELPKSIAAAISDVEVLKETRGGDVLAEQSARWRAIRQLLCGFYYVSDPEPPAAWRYARRRWHCYVRAKIDEKIPGLDSMLLISNALDRHGPCEGLTLLNKWRAVRGTHRENHRPEWVHQRLIPEFVMSNGYLTQQHAIIWTEFPCVGKLLYQTLGIPFYGRGGLDSKGNFIESEDGKRTIVASIQANSEGRNLQMFRRALVLTPRSDAGECEQLIGRIHRSGQEAPRVGISWMLGHPSVHKDFANAKRKAKYIQQTTGQAQRLLFANDLSTSAKGRVR